MRRRKLYLAGPEVFLADAVAVGARKKALCEDFGFLGLFPLDNALSGDRLDEKIYAANVALMRSADAGIFNLSPFRGTGADPGTAFELGFFAALEKPAFAYTASAENYFARVASAHGARATPDGAARDALGLLIENFGNADNLMLDAALKAQGREVILPARTTGLDDLDAFVACLRQARAWFHGE